MASSPAPLTAIEWHAYRAVGDIEWCACGATAPSRRGRLRLSLAEAPRTRHASRQLRPWDGPVVLLYSVGPRKVHVSVMSLDKSPVGLSLRRRKRVLDDNHASS